MSELLDTLIKPDWPAPATVKACVTTRYGGISNPPWNSLNLGYHVGDDPQAVAINRERLRMAIGLAHEPHWLQQVHGNRVAELVGSSPAGPADASVSRIPGEACVILSADCLPVLFTDIGGNTVAAAHAGWRGLAAGVLEAVVGAMCIPPAEILAWLGPAISTQAYEVGDEVRDAMLLKQPGTEDGFSAGPAGRWYCDLYALAREQLSQLGVTAVYGGNFCTFSDSARFYSYRRDGRCGRVASIIWLTG